MSDAYRVRLRTVGDGPTALGEAGPFTLVTDRPPTAGGGGLGFNGGQLLYLSIAACWSNDLYREAATMGIELDNVEITVDGDFPARGSGSTPITVDLVVRSSAPEDQVRELIAEVERVAEIPRSIRDGAPIEVRATHDRRP
ncbi:MAG TPA: OsmC family protein [Candidatus Limnocylindrales bacterium]|nr:OsmC family protein [Candidatus Limnocylindrales bacterium]